MASQESKLTILNKQPVFKPETKISFKDEPKQLGQAVHTLKDKIITYQDKHKVPLVSLFSETPSAKDLLDLFNFKDATFESNDEKKLVILTALFHSDVIEKNKDSLNLYLSKDSAFEKVHKKLQYIITQPTRILDQDLCHIYLEEQLNPLLAWYIQELLQKPDLLTQIIKNVYDQGKVPNNLVFNILNYSYLFGFLELSQLQTSLLILKREAENNHIFEQLALPIKEFFQQHRGSLESETLSRLKNFWPEYFKVAWFSAARKEGLHSDVLDAEEQLDLQAKASPDLRAHLLPPNVIKHRNKEGFKQTSNQAGYKKTFEQEAIAHGNIDAQVRRSNAAFQNNFEVVLKPYLHEKFQQGTNRQAWEHFRSLFLGAKDELVIEVLQQELSNAPLNQSNLETTLEKIATILDLQRLKDLFSKDFDSLSPIIKLSLICFGAFISIGEVRLKYPQAAVIIQNRLLPLLENEYDSPDKQQDSDKNHAVYSFEELSLKTTEAKTRLASLDPKESLCSAYHPKIEESITEKKLLIKELEKLFNYHLVDNSEFSLVFFQNAAVIFSIVLPLISGIYLGPIFNNLTLQNLNFESLPLQFFTLLIGLTSGIHVAKERQIRLGLKKLYNSTSSLSSDLTIENQKDIAHHQIKENAKKIYKQVITLIIISTLFFSFENGLDDIKNIPNEISIVAGLNQSEFLSQLNIPEQNNSEQLSNTPYTEIYSLLTDLPDGLQSLESEALFYQTDSFVNSLKDNNSVLATLTFGIFENSFSVERPTQVDFNLNENQFAVRISQIDRHIIPPDGFRIVSIYHNSHLQIFTSILGSFAFETGQLPSEVVLVLEEIPEQEMPNVGEQSTSLTRVQEMPHLENTFPDYFNPTEIDFNQMFEESFALNESLSADPVLADIHFQMVEQAYVAYTDWESGITSDQEFIDRYDQIATDFAVIFARYMENQRFYSLDYQMTGNSVLTDMADDPSQAPYCSIAQASFQEFMASIGVQVVLKPGANAFAFDEEIYVRIGHVNGYLILPGGTILLIDMTPHVPKPGADLSPLEFRTLEEVGTTQSKRNKYATLLAMSMLGLGAKITSKELKKKERKIKELLSKKTLKQKIFAELKKNPTSSNATKTALNFLWYTLTTQDPGIKSKFRVEDILRTISQSEQNVNLSYDFGQIIEDYTLEEKRALRRNIRQIRKDISRLNNNENRKKKTVNSSLQSLRKVLGFISDELRPF